MDGALTVPPRVQAVPPVRNTSASSMQSPPASADATSVIILSLVFARPGASPRSRRCRTSSGRPRCRARVAGRSSPALATKRRSSKVIWIRSGWLRGSIYWVLLFRGRFFATKPLSQKHSSTFLPPQDANPNALLRWIRAYWGPSTHICQLTEEPCLRQPQAFLSSRVSVDESDAPSAAFVADHPSAGRIEWPCVVDVDLNRVEVGR